MPYKDPERKRQWEREHREQRNARRRMQRLTAQSGQRTPPTSASELVAALRNRVRKPAPDPVVSRKPHGTWKTILGWAWGIGAVLVAAFASVSQLTTADLGPNQPN